MTPARDPKQHSYVTVMHFMCVYMRCLCVVHACYYVFHIRLMCLYALLFVYIHRVALNKFVCVLCSYLLVFLVIWTSGAFKGTLGFSAMGAQNALTLM